MVELDGGREPSSGGEEDDDIARFERQCAERAQAEGLLDPVQADEDGCSDDEDDERIKRVRLIKGSGPSPKDNSQWQQKCGILQEQLARRETELQQIRGDMNMIRSESIGPNDPNAELKQRLLDLTKKNRRLQVTSESQRSRIQQLEAEVKKPRDEVHKQAQQLAAQAAANMVGDGGEDWKKKYLGASNKLQEVRHEAQDLRMQLQRARKVLLKELGAEDAIEKALSVVDDPHSSQWKGRAAQISQLQRQIKELKEQAKKTPDATAESEQGNPSANGAARKIQRGTEAIPARERLGLEQAADKRREEFEKLQEEAERLRGEHADGKRKRDALKSRNGMLESQLRELRGHVQTLIQKSDNDDGLVAAMRRQLGRCGITPEDLQGPGAAGEGEILELRRQNTELQAQLDKQAQQMQQIRQRNLEATLENGSARLGPKSVESATSDRQLVERVRFLEAENAKQVEQVRLLRKQIGEEAEGGSRPHSAGSTLDLRDKMRQMSDRLAQAERENLALRQRNELIRTGSSPSCRSSRSSSRGVA